jgi:hypothetical protein
VPDLSTADPLAEAVTWLRAHPRVLAEFGATGAVSGRAEPPYPHLAIIPSAGGDDRELVWDVAPELQVETYGHPDGSPGRAELRRLHYVAVTALREITLRPHTATMTVVSNVVPIGSAQWVPLPLGQDRWLSTLRVVVHPALA